MAMERKTRISVLISGNGTNLQALIDALSNELDNCEIVRVTSNRKAAFGLERAKKAGIPTYYHNLVDYKKSYSDSIDQARSEYDHDLAVKLLEDRPSICVCAGWMHILTPAFLDLLDAANVPVINLHPGLRGRYNGANAIERAHQDFLSGKIKKMGIMIHYVISEVDMGEPIREVPIPFIEGDEDLETLKARVHEKEHEAIVAGTKIAISDLKRNRRTLQMENLKP